jgi:hypothetical protein
MEERGKADVKTICYKPEGRGFEIRWGKLIYFNLSNYKDQAIAAYRRS